MRLKELEAEAAKRQQHSKLIAGSDETAFVAVADGRVNGYRMALNDLKPVLEAAQLVVDSDQSLEIEVAVLRKALKGVKGD